MTQREQHLKQMDEIIDKRREKRMAMVTRLQGKLPYKIPKIGRDTIANGLRNNCLCEDAENILINKHGIGRISRIVSAGYRRTKRSAFKQLLNEYFGLHYRY